MAEQFDVIKLSVQAISEMTACMIESLRISNSLQFQDEEDRKAIHLAGYKIDQPHVPLLKKKLNQS